jgi:hypothetical protein
MNSPVVSQVRSTKPALELISLATMSPEVARQNLRALLIANPEYFGRISSGTFKAVLRIQQDTSYESIGYVQSSQSFERLQATINISQCTGYSDADCVSKEYVRFYLSYDGGTCWHDQGLSSISVCNTTGPKPLQETAEVDISPAPTLCINDRLLMVRMILSWNSPPPADMPDWIPVWGDVLSARIHLEKEEDVPLNSALPGITKLELTLDAMKIVSQRDCEIV